MSFFFIFLQFGSKQSNISSIKISARIYQKSQSWGRILENIKVPEDLIFRKTRMLKYVGAFLRSFCVNTADWGTDKAVVLSIGSSSDISGQFTMTTGSVITKVNIASCSNFRF